MKVMGSSQSKLGRNIQQLKDKFKKLRKKNQEYSNIYKNI